MTPELRHIPALSYLLFMGIFLYGCGNGSQGTGQGNAANTHSFTNNTNDPTNAVEQEWTNQETIENPPNEAGITGKKKRHFEPTSGQRDPENNNETNSPD